MRTLSTPRMRKLLAHGIRRAKLLKQWIREGTLVPLFYEKLPNGWYYQVDAVRDGRMNERPFVAVHAFKPPYGYGARSADYVLTKDL